MVLTNCSNNDGPWQFPEKLIPVVILTELGWCQRLREQGRTSGGQLGVLTQPISGLRSWHG